FKTFAGWWVQQSFRDQPELSQRRHLPKAQSRIHHAGSVLGICRFREDGESRRRTDLLFGREDLRLADNRASRRQWQNCAHGQSETAMAPCSLSRSNARSCGGGLVQAIEPTTT